MKSTPFCIFIFLWKKHRIFSFVCTWKFHNDVSWCTYICFHPCVLLSSSWLSVWELWVLVLEIFLELFLQLPVFCIVFLFTGTFILGYGTTRFSFYRIIFVLEGNFSTLYSKLSNCFLFLMLYFNFLKPFYSPNGYFMIASCFCVLCFLLQILIVIFCFLLPSESCFLPVSVFCIWCFLFLPWNIWWFFLTIHI